MKVKIFSTKTCVYCPQVKKYLTMKGVPFEEEDAFESEEYKTLGVLTVPVAKYGDMVVVGPKFGELAELVRRYKGGKNEPTRSS